MTEKRFEIDSKIYREIDIRYFLKDNNNELVDSYGDEIYWGDSTNGLKQIVDKLNELVEENQRLKKQIEEYEEQKENDSTINRNDSNNSEKDDEKNCGLCKHYNLDGMFGVWCDIHEIPTHDKYCSDFKRNRR